MLLAIETATDVCSVVYRDESGELFEKRTGQRGQHSEKLFVFIQELMDEHNFRMADLKGVIVSEGPGSYTGLRIAASAVKGLLYDLNVPLYGANTLASFARSALSADNTLKRIHAVIDARRVHLYHQLFSVKEGGLEPQTEVTVRPVKEVEKMLGREEGLVGTGLKRLDYDSIKKTNRFDESFISARSLITLYNTADKRLIRQDSPEQFKPRYYTSRQVHG
jgi:tRNA threonylcarbamoyladenosine biosynthesis protein TsaB